MPGMEPGSQDYADRFSNGTLPLSKTMRPYSSTSRVSETTAVQIHTDITFGDNSISYGTINPADAVHHLYDVCKFSACDPTTPYQVDTQVICRFGQNSYPCGKTLSLHVDGQYDGWEERNHYVDAIVAAFSQGQTWKLESWRSCNTGGAEKDCDSGEIWTGKQSNFISVENFDSSGSLHGHMSVTVLMDPANGGACAAITGIGGAVLKAVNPIAGPLFGLFKGFCGGTQFF